MKNPYIRKSIRKIKDWLSLPGILLGFLIIPWLPRKAVVFLAKIFSVIAFDIGGRDKKVAMANLRVAFPGLDNAARGEIAKESFFSFGLMLLDLFWFSVNTRQRIQKWIKKDDSFDYILQKRPLIALTAHLGNWEIMGQFTAMNSPGLVSIAAKFSNPFVQKFIIRQRTVTGQEIIPQHGALRVLLRKLREKCLTALLADQNTLPAEGGEFVDLFGIPASVARTAAALQGHTGVDVIFVYCVADKKGVYTVKGLKPLTGDEIKSSGIDLTRKSVQMLEEVVRMHPGNWIWSYKRWKYVPAGHARERFPFYAREIKPEDVGF